MLLPEPGKAPLDAEDIAKKLRELDGIVEALRRANGRNKKGWPLSSAEYIRAHDLVYEITITIQPHELGGTRFSERMRAQYCQYLVSYASDELGTKFLEGYNDRKDMDSSSLQLVCEFAQVWRRLMVFNSRLAKVFRYLNTVSTPDSLRIEQSGLNAIPAALPGALINKVLFAVQHVMTTLIEQHEVSILEAVLDCTEVLQLTNKVDPSVIEDVTYGVLESSRKRVINGDQLAVVAHEESQGELISKTLPERGFKILARFYESNNRQSIERLVQNPSFSSTLFFHINSAIRRKDQAVHLQASKMLYQFVQWTRGRTSLLGELRRPILNILLQDAMDQDPSGAIAKTSRSALECFTFPDNHIGCLRILTVLCTARDQHHGMHSKFKGFPSDLIRVMHEVLCPFTRRRRWIPGS